MHFFSMGNLFVSCLLIRMLVVELKQYKICFLFYFIIHNKILNLSMKTKLYMNNTRFYDELSLFYNFTYGLNRTDHSKAISRGVAFDECTKNENIHAKEQKAFHPNEKEYFATLEF